MISKFKKIVICAVAAAMFVISLAGCAPKVDNNEYPHGVHRAVITDTNTILCEKMQTGYKILVPSDTQYYEDIAAKELRELFKLSTGIELEIVKDTDIKFDGGSKYLSVGQTRLFTESGISVNIKELKTTGYRILTKDNSILMLADSNSIGIVYSVHGLLRYMIDFKAAASY